MFLEGTEFYNSLPEKEKRVYDLYFQHPKSTREKLASLAGCKRYIVDRFLRRPELKEEMRCLFLARLTSPEMLEVIDQMFLAAKQEKGFKDRKYLIDMLILPQAASGLKNTVIEIINKDRD